MMKKLVLGITVFVCVTASGMDDKINVSYHSFSIRPKTFPVSFCKTENIELNRKLTECSERFQRTPCSLIEDIAEKLIGDYKDIYADSDRKSITKIEEEEKLILSGQSVTEEMGAKLAKMCKGAPVAAFHLSRMYEVIGAYKLALLWIYVAYKLGFDSGKEAERILLLIPDKDK